MSKTTRSNDWSNGDRIEKVLERRRSGASGAHGDRRLRRQRTRSAVRRTLIAEATR